MRTSKAYRRIGIAFTIAALSKTGSATTYDTTCTTGYYLNNGLVCTPCSPGKIGSSFDKIWNRLLLHRWYTYCYESMLTRLLLCLCSDYMHSMPCWVILPRSNSTSYSVWLVSILIRWILSMLRLPYWICVLIGIDHSMQSRRTVPYNDKHC